MAEPQLEIEKRLGRIELAITMLAAAVSPVTEEGIKNTLYPNEEQQDAGTEDEGRVQVRQEGEAVQGERGESESAETGPSNPSE